MSLEFLSGIGARRKPAKKAARQEKRIAKKSS